MACADVRKDREPVSAERRKMYGLECHPYRILIDVDEKDWALQCKKKARVSPISTFYFAKEKLSGL